MVEEVLLADDDQSSKSSVFPNELSWTFSNSSQVISRFCDNESKSDSLAGVLRVREDG
jgi:hypothetical protein